MATLAEQLNAAHCEVNRLRQLILNGGDAYPVGTILHGSFGNTSMDVLLFKIDGDDTRDGNHDEHNDPHWVSLYDDFSGQPFATLGDAKDCYSEMLTWTQLVGERPPAGYPPFDRN